MKLTDVETAAQQATLYKNAQRSAQRWREADGYTLNKLCEHVQAHPTTFGQFDNDLPMREAIRDAIVAQYELRAANAGEQLTALGVRLTDEVEPPPPHLLGDSRTCDCDRNRRGTCTCSLACKGGCSSSNCTCPPPRYRCDPEGGIPGRV